MSLQAQVFIIIMVVGFVLGGIAALSDKGRGLVTADPIVTTIVHSTFAALIFVVVTRIVLSLRGKLR